MSLHFRWFSRRVPAGMTLVVGFPGWFLPRLYLYEGQKLIIGNWRVRHLGRLLKMAWSRWKQHDPKYRDYVAIGIWNKSSTKAPLPATRPPTNIEP